MKILQSHIVPPETQPQRLSDYARLIFPKITSRKGIKKAILRHEILVDGLPAETGKWVKPAQKIDWVELDGPPPKILSLPLEVIFEDEHLAVIRKPAGIVVSGNQFRTVENALLFNLKKSIQTDALRQPRAVHRLDNLTSGILLIAKTAQANVHLCRQFEQKTIEKRYEAIVMGKLEGAGQFDLPIENRSALTFFQTKKIVRSLKNEWLTQVELFPKTGRTHQLRIHLSNAGFPILGDALYGKEGLILQWKGLFLAAVGITFAHPQTEEKLTFTIDAPKKFDKILEREERRWEKYFSQK